MSIAADIDVTYKGKTTSLAPRLIMDQAAGGKYSIPVALPGERKPELMLSDIRLPFGADLFTSNLPDPAEMVMLDISTKPLIWLVWGGTVLYTIAGFIAYRRRALEMVRPERAPEEAEEPEIVRDRVPAGAPAHA
jgi:hypothetical protein